MTAIESMHSLSNLENIGIFDYIDNTIFMTYSINIQVERVTHHKHQGVLLDEKLNFKQHINTTILKIHKGISVIKKLRHSLPQKSLMTIYKAFLRPLIDYGDIIYDQPQNESFCEKLESVQYNPALATTGAIHDPLVIRSTNNYN